MIQCQYITVIISQARQKVVTLERIGKRRFERRGYIRTSIQISRVEGRDGKTVHKWRCRKCGELQRKKKSTRTIRNE